VLGGMCSCTPIFSLGIALRPEECDELTRPSFASIVSCVKSLSLEEKRLCYNSIIWWVLTFEDYKPADLSDRI
jgi:hypothetical protein